MIIIKFFASIILLFFAIVLFFVIISFLLAKNFLSDVNDSLAKKFNNESTSNNQYSNNSDEIPSAIECSKCGTFYAQMPENNLCSCGNKLG